MKNFKVVNYRIYDAKGNDVAETNQFYNFIPSQMTRNIARKIKNVLNLLSPEAAPFRIAEVRITK